MEPPPFFPPQDGFVVVENVHKSFGNQHILRGIGLRVARGEVVCVIGPSGSGKSTLLRCVNRLEEPSGGTVLFDGEPVVAGTRLRAQRARMGMVFQHFNLFAHMTVLGNVIEAPIQVLGLTREEAIARGRRLLERVGLADKADSLPARLSGGQKQRVAIARCLAMEPRLLLLDEITSALDPELVGEVLQVIRDLTGQGMTIDDRYPRDGVRARGGGPHRLHGWRADCRAGVARGALGSTPHPKAAPLPRRGARADTT